MADRLVICPDCEGDGFFLVRNRASIHYVACPDALYDALPCETCEGTGEIECPHLGALMNPRPAERQDGRVVRWACDCTCGAEVVIDARTGEDASERSRNVFKHGSNIPPSAA